MREKLIEVLTKSKILCEDCGPHGSSYCIEAIADHLIANGVTIQRWIPVSERLPEMWQNVLTVRTDGAFRLDFVGSLGVWYDDVNFVGYPVTHWMPLPLPPKEGE